MMDFKVLSLSEAKSPDSFSLLFSLIDCLTMYQLCLTLLWDRSSASTLIYNKYSTSTPQIGSLSGTEESMYERDSDLKPRRRAWKSLVLCGYNSRQYKNSSAAAHRLWFPFFLSSCPPLASFNIDQPHIYLCLSSCINIFLWPYTHSPVFEFYFLNLFSLWSWLDWLDLAVMYLCV